MAIYFRPGGNNANGGTNPGTDALQSIDEAVSRFDPTDPSKREVIACTDTPGATQTQWTRFTNVNQALFQYPTSESQRLTLMTRPGDRLILNPTGYTMRLSGQVKYIDIINMIADGSGYTSGPGYLLEVVDGQHVRTIENEFFDSYQHNMYFSGSSRDCVISGNLVYNAGRVNGLCNNVYSQGFRMTMEDNVSFYDTYRGSSSNGLRLYTNSAAINGTTVPHTHNSLIQRNWSKGAATNYAIDGEHVLFCNNVGLLAVIHALLVIEQTTPNPGVSNDIRIINNTLYGPGSGNGIHFWNGIASGVDVVNNILRNFSTPVSWNGVTPRTELTNLTTDPLFEDIGADDFRIMAGSNAKDAGTTWPEVGEDFFRNARPSDVGYDIGAHEYQISTPPPPPGPVSKIGLLPRGPIYIY